jgi:hypothetical protein
VVVEGGVMDLGLDMVVREHRLPKQLVNVGHDVGGIQQVVVGQVADRAPKLVATAELSAELA